MSHGGPSAFAPSCCARTGHDAVNLSAKADKKHANARTAAHTPTSWNRSAWLTSVFQFLGGALSCQVSVALLIGTVPMTLMTLMTLQMSTPSKPALRSHKPGAAPSSTVATIADSAVGT